MTYKEWMKTINKHAKKFGINSTLCIVITECDQMRTDLAEFNEEEAIQKIRSIIGNKLKTELGAGN